MPVRSPELGNGDDRKLALHEAEQLVEQFGVERPVIAPVVIRDAMQIEDRRHARPADPVQPAAEQRAIAQGREGRDLGRLPELRS